MSRRVQAVGLAAVLGAAVALSAALPTASAATAPSQARPQALHGLHPMYDVGVHSHLARPLAGAVANSIPNFAARVNDHGKTFTYTMAGKNPMVKQAAPSTTVKTIVVPLIIKLPGIAAFDPTRGDRCDATSSLARTLSSPVFASHAFTFGGTSVGSTQYVDAYQRANFWKFARPGALNPGYHVLLGKNSIAAQTVNVPASAAATSRGVCGPLGAVEISWLDNHLRTTVIPSLKRFGVNSTNFPVFLTDNVVEFIGTPATCCVLGFHSAFSSAATGGRPQTYGIAMYDNTGSFLGSKDISALTHEVAEWMDDPFVNNPTKPWGHVGQVTRCQANLENGDPLSGTIKPVAVGAKTYHVQELAFESWFYHRAPSFGINGWYSDFGKFRKPAAPCV